MPQDAEEFDDLEPLVLLEDEPVQSHEQDELGLLPFSRIIASAALGTRGPFTIGVYGAWGEGKTSVLNQAKALLDRESGKRDNIVTVWFNAWQFEHEEHPIVPLVSSIVDQIERTLHERKTLAERDREAVGKAFKKVSNALRSVAYGFSYGGFSAKDMINRYDELQRSGHPTRDRSLYYNAYAVLSEAIPKKMREGDIDDMPRIVVFIDDLDRCLPAKAVRLLESIKLVLTQPGFIFALAVYKPVVQAYIDAETNRQLKGVSVAHRGVEYLDKIIQLALPVPSHESRFAKYVEDLLAREMFRSGEHSELKGIVIQLKDVLAPGVRHNPRTLVRLINNLIVDRTLYLAVNEAVEDEAELLGLFAISRILQTQIRDEELYEHIVDKQAVCKRILDAKDLADLRRADRERDEKIQPDLERYGEQLTKGIIDALDRAPHLFDLLKSQPGRKWLEDSIARRAVTHFLKATRTEPAETQDERPQSQEEIVDAAVRESLGLSEVSKITSEDYEEVRSLALNASGINDAWLERIVERMPNLDSLFLFLTAVTDDGVRRLSKLKTLTALDLGGTQVTDVGLQHLPELTALRRLSLVDTEVTDAGLEHLAGMTTLDMLFIRGTKVTLGGIKRFREALPGCQVFSES